MATIGAYVSDEEADLAKKIAEENHTTVSKIVKNAFSKIEIKDQNIELKKINELKKLGNNLNQIMPYLHVRKSLDKQTFFAIQEIKKHIKDMLC